MQHVAENLVAHALWVGTEVEAAKREHDGLLQLAEDYRGIAQAAQRTAATMRGMRELAATPHEPERWDRPAFVVWMRRKIDLQRALAGLILERADTSERALSEISSCDPKP